MGLLHGLVRRVIEGKATNEKKAMPLNEAKAENVINSWTNVELVNQLEALLDERFQRQPFRMR